MWNFLPAEVLPVTYKIKNLYVNKLYSLCSSSHNLYSLLFSGPYILKEICCVKYLLMLCAVFMGNFAMFGVEPLDILSKELIHLNILGLPGINI